jgi:cobalt-precorrin 5A hydrolase
MTQPAESAPYIIAFTPSGNALGQRIAREIPGAIFWVPLACHLNYPEAQSFDSLRSLLTEAFRGKHPLICIMATGIVVRHLAAVLQSKELDPAVVVVDEGGRFAISLISGHLGGANKLARTVAELIGATPVITTATDVQGLPALDVLGPRLGLHLENLRAVKEINMGLLRGQRIILVDPANVLQEELSDHQRLFELLPETAEAMRRSGPAVYVGNREYVWPEGWLRLRPRNLMVGVGCNKGTSAAEILEFLESTFKQYQLSMKSINTLATIDAKKDEPGLQATVARLGVNFIWYTKEELQQMQVPNPSDQVARHMGVASVSEAAALRAAGTQTLLVPKQKSANVTLAVAQVCCPLSA